MARGHYEGCFWKPHPIEVYDFNDVAEAKSDERHYLGAKWQDFRANLTDENFVELSSAMVRYKETIKRLDRRLAKLKEPAPAVVAMNLRYTEE